MGLLWEYTNLKSLPGYGTCLTWGTCTYSKNIVTKEINSIALEENGISDDWNLRFNL